MYLVCSAIDMCYHRRRSIQCVGMKKESAETEAPYKVLFCFNLEIHRAGPDNLDCGA
jgi:hypothetical protein